MQKAGFLTTRLIISSPSFCQLIISEVIALHQVLSVIFVYGLNFHYCLMQNCHQWHRPQVPTCQNATNLTNNSVKHEIVYKCCPFEMDETKMSRDIHHFSPVVRKHIFGRFYQVRQKPAYAARETVSSFQIPDI